MFLYYSLFVALIVIADQVAAIKAQVGSGRVICGLSGGVDSAVAAALVALENAG